MAQAPQDDQATLVARLSSAGTTRILPVRNTARTGHADAINSVSPWFKIFVRSQGPQPLYPIEGNGGSNGRTNLMFGVDASEVELGCALAQPENLT